VTAAAFFSELPYRPDAFQVDAAAALEEESSVVVAAPTGAGKTLVAEVAIHLALERGGRTFYTTPIKALSNQKFGDLVDQYGAERVGLLTGDNSINGDADIVVMTTEVLRNMIYAGRSGLDRLQTVILDEVHYLADRARGSVWEEVIIHAPQHIQFVCLSATVANPEEFTGWIESRRGPTQLVVETNRPVPLEPMYLITDLWSTPKQQMFPMLAERAGVRVPNPQVQRLLAAKTGRRRRFATPRRPETVEVLHSADMLPAIYFIFSRAGCEAAAHLVATSGLRLTTAEERIEIRKVALRATDHLDPADLETLDFGRWLADLESGSAAHHAGLVPAFKEAVERLFEAGLVKVVFATETLALGINMPAKSVVIESLSKFNGESHELLGPSDYTQLTGRAGRRGIDTVGYGITLYSRFVRFEKVTEIASAGSSKLESSFRPTYNMAVNLVANYDQARAEELLLASFAEYQLEQRRVQRQDGKRRKIADLEQASREAECELGDVWEYLDLVDGIEPGGGVDDSARPGDVFTIDHGGRPGRYLLLQRTPSSDTPVVALATSGKVRRLRSDELSTAMRIGRIDFQGAFRPRDRKFQQRALQRLRSYSSSGKATPIGHTVDHPVADCPDADAHLRRARAARRIERKLAGGPGEDGSLVDEFRALLGLLEQRGYTAGWSLTERGERLRSLYGSLDLVVAEAVSEGLFDGMDPAELAAAASVFVWEPRSEEAAAPVPASLLGYTDGVGSIWSSIVDLEAEAGLRQTRAPEPGFMEPAYHWAQGLDLEEILEDIPIEAGDFVRVARQLLDQIRQIRDAAPHLAGIAGQALRQLDRGVVAAGGRL
ncbi:MAG: DEAD/DEAH box helicase, partial [Acidimicrobiia bacterium]|nr:DEAD/DEAH box helicase [Acidimicrobiia bacterium]